MTTSFTTTEKFGTQMGDDFGDDQQYPELFGITFTPQVTGIAIGVAGLLVAGYLLWSQILPIWGELSTLKAQKADKQNQVNQLQGNELQKKIQQKTAELEQSQKLKGEVVNLFANDKSLESLLLDISNFANLSNLRLKSYAPSEEKSKVVNDSFGTLANNNLQIRSYNLELEGTFAQLQIFLQDLERLQPLLVVNQFNANVNDSQNYVLKNNQLVSVGEPKITGNVTLNAVFPDIQPATPETAPTTPTPPPTETK